MIRIGSVLLAVALFTACGAASSDGSSGGGSGGLGPSAPALPSDDSTPVNADSHGWTFYGAPAGLPQDGIYGVSADQGGNIWVAGGAHGLFVLEKGATAFKSFPTDQPAISVAGGPAGTAFVGYMGKPDCDMAFDTGGSPAVYKSGDADRVWLSGGSLQHVHYDISSGPGVVAAEPQGREKLCNIYRIAYDPKTSSVWFGANHGVAWGDPASTQVIEHTHPAINGYLKGSDGQLHYTLLSGNYFGLGVLPNGNLWLGGRERSALFPYGTNGHDFFKADTEIQKAKVDVWPDAVPQDPRPEQEVADDTYGFAPMSDGSAWVASATRGVAYVNASGSVVAHFQKALIEPRVLSMATDPSNQSMWAGHADGGITRAVSGGWVHFGTGALGSRAHSRITDIQVLPGTPRKMLIAFFDGAIGVYDGQ